MEKNAYKIYGIMSPITNKIKYIGLTSLSIEERLKHHWKERKYSTTLKGKWLKELDNKNLKPTIIILEDDISYFEIGKKEKYYIKKYKDNGYELVNSTDGGEMSKTYIPEVREKISKSLKKYYETHDCWCKGKKIGCSWSEKQIEEQRIKMTGEGNHMYNKTILDVWIEKYGKEEAESKFKEWSKKKRKATYDYDLIYDLYITKNLEQIEIGKRIGLSKAQMCRIIKKFDLKKFKKDNVSFSPGKCKYDYNYEKLYFRFIILNKKTTDIAKEYNMSHEHLKNLLRKFNLRKIKKEIYNNNFEKCAINLKKKKINNNDKIRKHKISYK